MAEDVLTVRDVEDLDLLLSTNRRHTRRIELKLPPAPGHDLGDWEKRLNTHYRSCGCEAAAVAMAVALVSMVVVAVIFADEALTHPFVAAALGLGSLFLASGIGKAVGLHLARLRLKSVVISLKRALHQ